MRGVGIFLCALFVACGGSTENEPNGSGGVGGSGAKGSGGSGNASTGGSGGGTAGVGDGGAVAGTGGASCVDIDCGPHGAPCCEPNSGCGTAGPGSTLNCTCTSALVWDCSPTGSGGSGTGGTGGACNGPSGCAAGTTCCFGHCVNLQNDPFNCGSCGSACAANPPYCSGSCTKPPCFAPGPQPPDAICCGMSYCKPGQLCCDVQGPGPSAGPVCFTPTAAQPTCPIGCPLCQ